MDFEQSERERMILDGLRRFNDSEAVARENEHRAIFSDGRKLYDETGRLVPRAQELRRAVRVVSARSGYFNLMTPTELGGEGEDARTSFSVWENLHSWYGSEYQLPYQSVAHWAWGPGPLLLGLQTSLREELLDPIVRGERTVCFGMSEPDAGSDAWRMRTRAVRDGDDWVINGSKQWITNGPYADHAFVFAVTDPDALAAHKGGISCFLVDTGAAGFSVDGIIRLFGDVGGDEATLSFTDLRVGNERLVGEVGEGLRLAMSGVTIGRLYNSARCVGLAQWALRKSIKYSQERVTFGKPISENQAVSFMLAESAMEIYAAKYMGLHCSWLADQGKRPIKETSMAKAFATEMCFRVFDRAMQVHGGMGLTNDTHFYSGWHIARTVRIADGSSEILRRTIATQLLRGDVTF